MLIARKQALAKGIKDIANGNSQKYCFISTNKEKLIQYNWTK